MAGRQRSAPLKPEPDQVSAVRVIKDPVKLWITWSGLALGVLGFVAWGLIAGDFRWAWIPIGVIGALRIVPFSIIDGRVKAT